HVVIERFDRPRIEQARHPCGGNHRAIQRASSSAVLSHHPPKQIWRNAQLDHVDANPSQALPERTTKAKQVLGLVACFPPHVEGGSGKSSCGVHGAFCTCCP